MTDKYSDNSEVGVRMGSEDNLDVLVQMQES